MAEDFVTHDIVDLFRRSVEAGNRRDFDAQASTFAPDGVYDASPMGLSVNEGRVAIRDFTQETLRPYEEASTELEENLDLGGGLALRCSSRAVV
jgi:hypothetical protein